MRIRRVNFPVRDGREMEADYTPREMEIMRGLIDHPREAQLLHEMKATFNAAVVEDGPTPESARAGRDKGIQQVDEHADEEWKQRALDAIWATCRMRETFISDDVWEFGGLAGTREDRALGPQMLKAARQGWCVKTGELRPSIRSHLSGKPVWKSMIYEGGAS